MTDEEWRHVEVDPRYEVSNLGRVRSWANSRGGRRSEPRILALRPDSKGYPRSQIAGRDRFLHHMVLDAFVGPRGPGQEARHLNNDRADARVENLEWSTHAINMRDQYAFGTRARGASHGMAKLSEEQVYAIREATGRLRDIGAPFGVSASVVCNIKKGRTWSHLPNRASR